MAKLVAESHVERFREELCGISPLEIGGLLSHVLRQENLRHTSVSGRKRTRHFEADFMGIVIRVIEVNTRYGMELGHTKVDYHFDNNEWEFEVQVTSWTPPHERNPPFNSDHAHGFAHVGKKMTVIMYPYFEGDESAYKHDMAMIRLMGLENDEPELVII